MTDMLSPADRSALAAERGAVNMSMLGLILLERGEALSYEALYQRIEERLHLLPRYRQRLEQPPLGVGHPVWVDDEHFDLGWHLRQATLPAPGGEAELAAWVAREASRSMDRARPLWELHLIEGLAGGRVALVPKMHHALVDGMGAVGIAMVLVDPSPEPVPVDPPEREWTPRQYDLRRHLLRLASRPVSRAQELTMRATERLLDVEPRTAARELRQASELVAALAKRRPEPPALPFNRGLGPNRSYGFTTAPLAAVKAAGKGAGGTVNDAILAAVAGMLARYLRRAGAEPAALDGDPVALVPVSVRDPDDEGLGNRISVVMVDLPAGEADPARRIALVHERMEAIKASAEIRAGALRVDMTGIAPPLLSSALALAAGSRRAFNLVVSNVPGPQLPLYVNGARVEAVHPVVPLNPADQGLNLGVFSYDGKVCFGLAGDAALDPPLAAAVEDLDLALAELADAAPQPADSP